MNHQEAKDLLAQLLPAETLNLIKVEVFRLSWEGKGYNHVAEESGYDHDYVRKAGSQLWRELSAALDCSVTKRNFRPLLEKRFSESAENLTEALEYPGGAMSFSSPFYVERTEEEAQAYNEILRPGAILRIKGPRKTGKSSLMLRVLDQAESEGFATVKLDLLQTDSSILSDLDKFLRWFCLNICAQLNLEPRLDDYWNELLGSKLSCSNFIQQYVLDHVDKPLCLFVNELNCIYDHEDVSKDFLPLLRSWFEEAKHNSIMQNLRQVLIYSTEIYVQLDLNQSPFNVGLPIELKSFDGEQLQELAAVYGFNWRADGTANSPITLMLQELNGHPYLCQLVLYELASEQGFLESPSEALRTLISNASKPGALFSEFLQQLLEDFSCNERAVAGFKKLHGQNDQDLSRVEMYQLERSGLITIREGKPQPTSRLLSDFLLQNI